MSSYFKLVVIDEKKKPWQNYPAKMEFTTSVPKGGCAVDCLICPQKLLIGEYNGDRMMKLEDFKALLDKIPTEIEIVFSGFVEPWLNKHATDMVFYAHEKGYKISVYTTGVGMAPEDVSRLSEIPYYYNHSNGAGGFCLHLPDAEGIGRHPITPTYLETIKEFARLKHKFAYFNVMAMGPTPHPKTQEFFPNHWFPEFFNRAGNLERELKLKPELARYKYLYKSVPVADGPRTCGCDEHLYHGIVLPNGDVSLCCMDYGQDYILGNLHKSSFDDLMPKPQTCYDICRSCHVGVPPTVL